MVTACWDVLEDPGAVDPADGGQILLERLEVLGEEEGVEPGMQMEQLEVGQDVAAEDQVEVDSLCGPAVMEAVAVEAETWG